MNTFTADFFDDNVFCPRCLSYIPIENIESHTNQHDNSRFTDEVRQVTDDVFPRDVTGHSLRYRLRTTAEHPFVRLSRLHGLHRLQNTLQNTFQNTLQNTLQSTLHNTWFDANHRHDSEDDDDETDTFQYELNMYISNLLGDVEVGIPNINKVSQLIENSEVDCHICLDKVKTPRKLICNHVYCHDCISQWLAKNKKCPVCRVDLEEALKNMEKIEG
jgi:hypothetical protein